MTHAAPCLRLSPSAAVTRTEEGVILRSDLGAFQITGADAGAFVEKVLPLLDGSRDREALVNALAGYSRRSVTAFLDLLAARGLLSPVSDAEARWRGPEAFFRMWSAAPAEAMQRIASARVLLVGLPPWGATAAIELAAAGLGGLHLIDEGVVGPDDIALAGTRGEATLGAARGKVAAAMIAEQSPWCQVEESPMEALDAAPIIAERGPWSLLVAAIPPGESALVERVARFAHAVNVVSLWSHITGTSAVLGPLVTPGRTACRICATADALNPPLAERPSPASRASATGRLLIEDLTTLSTSLHTLVRLPWCRICGDPCDQP